MQRKIMWKLFLLTQKSITIIIIARLRKSAPKKWKESYPEIMFSMMTANCNYFNDKMHISNYLLHPFRPNNGVFTLKLRSSSIKAIIYMYQFSSNTFYINCEPLYKRGTAMNKNLINLTENDFCVKNKIIFFASIKQPPSGCG